jgi:two-component system, cell cycle response regulator
MSGSADLSDSHERRSRLTEAEHIASPDRQEDQGAYADGLTGCHNRRYLMEILEPQLDVGRDYGFPVSLIVCQLTNCRQSRFTFGDQLADSMLIEVASCMKSLLRKSDLVIRYGDDAFAVLLLHADEIGAATVARRLKSAVLKVSISEGSTEIITAASFGVGTSMPEDAEGRNELISKVELAIREAQCRGAGSVVCASELKSVKQG